MQPLSNSCSGYRDGRKLPFALTIGRTPLPNSLTVRRHTCPQAQPLFSGMTSAYVVFYQLNSFVIYKNLGGSPILTSAGTEPTY